MKLADRFKLYVEGYRDPFSRGTCYELGEHVEEDFEQALILYRQAMQQGDPRAYFRIATWHQAQGELSQALKMHYKAAMDDHEASKQTLKDLAENGHGEAAFLLGHVECKASNWKQALHWYQMAAQQEHPEAMYCLGQLHQNGCGIIEKDTAQAFACYGDAAKHGSKHALNELLDKSASQPNACFQLARLYELGGGGLVSQPQKALTLYTQASAMGHAQASVRLGQLEEKEADPDLPTAYRYYALAAYQHHSDAKIYLEQLALADNADAQYALGFHYYQAQGDDSQAAYWCVKAHTQGHQQALEYLRQTSFDGALCLQIARQYEANDASQYLSFAAEFYKKASDLGEAQASFRFAQLHETEHEGIPCDHATAYQYYALAARRLHPEAEMHLKQLVSSDNSAAQYALGFYYYREQRNVSQAVFWCVKASFLGHALALEYVTQTHFSASVYLQLARHYETDGTSEHLPLVVEFYKKASRLRDAQASFSLAQLYETGNEVMDANPVESSQYYVTAIDQKHPQARAQLERMASTGSAQAQYALGYHVYRKEGNTSQAVSWCVKAHRLGHALALDYLTQSHFSASVYLQMAHHYETDGSPQDISHAIECYKKASQQGNGQASFRLAQRYEAGYENVEPDHSTAYRYYALAARQRHPEAKTYLEQLALANHSEALYALGVHYYHEQDDVSQAVHWCVKAHLLGHALAFDYITQTPLTAPVYLQIARYYKTEGTVEHIPHAIEFYKKASALGEAQASFSLAQLYEIGNEVMDANPSESIHYYVLAIEQKHPDARMQLEHLASTGSAQAQYAFGYHVCRKEGDMAQAARWCVKAHLLGHALALDYLTQTRWSASLCMQIARHYETDGTSQHIFHAAEFYKKASEQDEAQASFQLAQWYETGKEALEQDSKASCAFYLLAMKQKHPQAKTQLEEMAVAGDAQAQYVFGYHICHQKGDVAQAARWCVKADIQGQPQAATYLARTPFRVQVCLKIARQYEAHKTDRVENHRKALAFYLRAAQQNNPNALFALAQWHELDHPGMKRNPRQAFDHYLKAAQQGHPDAWVPLERLGEQMNSQRKRKLGELYGECGEDERQAYWLKQVGDVQRLRLLKR